MALALNPIARVLEVLPHTEAALDPKLLDSIAFALKYHVPPEILSNEYIVMLLAYLTDKELVLLAKIVPVSSTGNIYFIKKL